MLALSLIVSASMASLVLATPARLPGGASLSGRVLAKRDAGKEIVLSASTISGTGGIEHDFYYIQDGNGCMQKTDIHVNTLVIDEVGAPLTIDAPYACTIDITKDGLQTMPAGMWFASTTDGQEIGTITCGSDAPGTCKIVGGGSGNGVSQTCNVNQGDEACEIDCGANMLGQISCKW